MTQGVPRCPDDIPSSQPRTPTARSSLAAASAASEDDVDKGDMSRMIGVLKYRAQKEPECAEGGAKDALTLYEGLGKADKRKFVAHYFRGGGSAQKKFKWLTDFKQSSTYTQENSRKATETWCTLAQVMDFLKLKPDHFGGDMAEYRKAAIAEVGSNQAMFGGPTEPRSHPSGVWQLDKFWYHMDSGTTATSTFTSLEQMGKAASDVKTAEGLLDSEPACSVIVKKETENKFQQVKSLAATLEKAMSTMQNQLGAAGTQGKRLKRKAQQAEGLEAQVEHYTTAVDDLAKWVDEVMEHVVEASALDSNADEASLAKWHANLRGFHDTSKAKAAALKEAVKRAQQACQD